MAHGNLGMPKAQALVERVARRQATPLRDVTLRIVPAAAKPTISFMEAIDAQGCLWCDGDPLGAHSFCGNARRQNSRWCEEHYARAVTAVLEAG